MWPWSKKWQTRKTIERRITRLALESLELRQVLSAGPASTAAMMVPPAGPPPLIARTTPSEQQESQIIRALRSEASKKATPDRPLCMR